jgi:hypothetical membrane protein
MTKMEEEVKAVLLLAIGSIQWFFIVLISEGLYPGYVSSYHYVSTLGTGQTANLYNASTLLLGVCVVTASFLIHRFKPSRLFFALLLIAGLGAIGLGVFPEDSRPMHGIVTPITLIFGGLAGAFAFKVQSMPLSYLSMILGAGSIAMGLLFIPYMGLSVESDVMYLGFYKGTLERIVIYPLILWMMTLGSQLARSREKLIN